MTERFVRPYPLLEFEIPRCKADEVVEEVGVDGWKGKSGIQVQEPGLFKEGACYVLTEYRKDKFSGEVHAIVTPVAWENVMQLWKLIEDWAVGMTFKPRYLWTKLIELHGWDIEADSFNGGRYRARCYFPFYYYPMKILEGKGVVFFGHDAIERVAVLKNNGIEVVR